MTEKIHPETIHRLLEIERDDAETIELLVTALESFEKYHQAIYRLEIQRKLYSCGAMDSETYRDLIPRLDSIRTQHHNAMLSEIRLLNGAISRYGAACGVPTPLNDALTRMILCIQAGYDKQYQSK